MHDIYTGPMQAVWFTGREERRREWENETGKILLFLGFKSAFQIKLLCYTHTHTCIQANTHANKNTHTHTQTHTLASFILELDERGCSMPLYPTNEITYPLYWVGPAAAVDSCRQSRASRDSIPRQSHLLCVTAPLQAIWFTGREDRRRQWEKWQVTYCIIWVQRLLFRSKSHTHTLFHFGARWVWVFNATPWSLNPRKEIRYPLYWVVPRLAWRAAENLVQARIQSPVSPVCSESLYQLRCPNPHISWHARELTACTPAECNYMFCSPFINKSVTEWHTHCSYAGRMVH